MNNSHQANASMNVSVTAATRGTVLIVVESCIFVLLNIAALVGNSLVCLAIYRNPSLRTVTNYFVLSLALTDLSMAVLVIPLDAASSIGDKIIGEDMECKIKYFGGFTLGGTSLLTVMLLAINRYFCVVRPALYNNIFSKKRSIVMAVCGWTTSLITVVGLFLVTRMQFKTFAIQPGLCYQIFPSAILSSLKIGTQSVYIAVPSLVVVACYLKIYQTIRQHNTAAASSSQGGHSAYGVEEAKVTRILTVAVVGFYLCWLPVLVANVMGSYIQRHESGLKYFNLYHNFPLFLSSVINPVIYGVMSQPFRKEFRKILQCRSTNPRIDSNRILEMQKLS